MISHLLAVDGGGSKTALRLSALTESGPIPISEHTLGPSSLTQQGEHAYALLSEAITQQLTSHQLNPAQCAVAIGVAGSGNPHLKAGLEQALSFCPHLKITSDAHISLLGANRGEPVNCLAIGTGSVATRLESNGDITLLGGWGFPIGDQGGGAWLGMQAVRALIRSYENNESNPLTLTLATSLGSQRAAILSWLKQADACAYAALAPLVLSHAQQGCSVSCDILQRGGQHIEQLVKDCCKNNDLAIVFLGSLGQYYQSRLSLPWQARCIIAQGDALDGATRLAHQLAGEHHDS